MALAIIQSVRVYNKQTQNYRDIVLGLLSILDWTKHAHTYELKLITKADHTGGGVISSEREAYENALLLIMSKWAIHICTGYAIATFDGVCPPVQQNNAQYIQ